MKKLFIMLAAVLLVLCFAGCTEYNPPADNTDGTDGPGIIKPEPGGPDDPADKPFSVALVFEGTPFIPEEPVNALWHDNDSAAIYSAPIGGGGIATIDGLDGDFRVTLSSLPVKKDIYGRRIEYTYDPNTYTATNDDKDVTITLYALWPTNGTGSDPYTNAIDIQLDSSNIAAFRATVNYTGHTVFFRFSPSESGVYSLRTLVDVTANVINPILDVYNGTVGWVSSTPNQTVDGGGVENTYTKNLVWEMTLEGNSYKGSVFIFAMRAIGLNANAFPIDIDFILDKDREFESDQIEYEVVEPEEEFKQAEREAGEFSYVAYLKPNNELDERMFKLWSKEEGGDGYYHFFTETTDPVTGENIISYGKTLYAKITQDTEIIETESGSGFTDGRMYKRFDGKDYGNLVSAYAQYVNADGAYPVTEELKNFIQGFSCSQSLFNDGDGIAESWGGYNSSETSQWLFACGYYNG